MSKEHTERYNFFDTIANIGTAQNVWAFKFHEEK